MSDGVISEVRASGGRRMNGPPILFVDLDGTVRKGRDELGRYVNGPEDVEVFPEAVGLLARWSAAGGVTIGVTNQGGVALGHMSVEACMAATRRTIELCQGTLHTVFTCVHAPDAGCFCRKPSPGMLFRGVEYVEAHGASVVRQACLMVGDRPEDAQAAHGAGVDFLWAAEWRATV